MAKQTINLGSGPDSYTGDSLNVAFTKINENFTDLYSGNAAGNIRASGNIIANTSLRTDGFIRGQSLEIIANAVVLGTISANNFTYSNGVALGDLSNSNINTSGNISGNNLTANNLYSGNVYADTGDFVDLLVSGNLTVNGNTTFVDVTRTTIEDPLIEIGGNAAGTALTSNDTKDRGLILHYYNGAARDAFIGWDNSSSEIRIASNAIVVNNEVLLWDTYANVRAGNFIGNGSQLTGITSYTNANVISYAQTGWAGNIIPNANATYSLGSETNQWANLWVANNTIYIGGVPLGIGSGNVLTINGEPLLSNSSTTSISTTGNVSANVVDAVSLVGTSANLGDLRIEYAAIYKEGSGEDRITISPDLEGQAYLQIPDNINANVLNVRLHNDVGNIELGTGNGVHIWTFGADGDLALPTGKTIRNTDGVNLLTSRSGSEPYKGFRAHYGTMYNNGDDENGPINKLVIYKASVAPTSAIDADTSSDDFQVTGLAGSDVVAMLVIVSDGTDWATQTPATTLKTFVEAVIDEVILDDGVEGQVRSVADMKAAFYSNFNNFKTIIDNVKTDLEFFNTTPDPQYTIGNVTYNGSTGAGAYFNSIQYSFTNSGFALSNWGQNAPGGYEVGDTFTILGTDIIDDSTGLALASPANDTTLTVVSVFDGGYIDVVSITSGIPVPAEPDPVWPDASIDDGGNDEYDGGNAIHTDLESEISYNDGNVVTSSSAFGGGDYVVTYESGIFGIFATNANINTIGTSGDSGGYGNDSGSSGFDGDGDAVTGGLYVPVSNVELIISGNILSGNSRINFVSNSSGDGYGSSTIELIPSNEDTVGPDQYLIIDPTSPNHIHIRAGGQQDNSQSQLYLGGENSYFKVNNGTNPNLSIAANNNVWTFGVDGRLTFPGTPRIDIESNNFEVQAAENINLEANAVVNIYTDTSGSAYQWQFGDDGNLLLPSGGAISEGSAPLQGSSIVLTPAGGSNANQALKIYPTGAGDGDHIHLTSGGGSTELYLGTDYHYVKLANTGDVIVNSDDGQGNTAQWAFGTDGNLYIPGTIIFNSSPAALSLGTLSTQTVDASGNISANFFIGDGSQLTGIPAGYTDSNATTLLSNLGSNSINTSSNITAGNILTNNYFYANGVAFTPGSNYGNSNVTSLLAALGSNSINTTGNITAGNISGNISITGNVTGTSTNVTLMASSYSWTFDNLGNLTLPGNTFAVKYANGTVVSLGSAGNYGDSNVASLLGSFGSNAVSTTGNLTGGNLSTSGNLNFTANTGNIVFNNGASIHIDSGALGRNGSIVLNPYTGAGSTFPGVVIGGAGRLLSPGGSVHQIFNASDVTFQVPIKSTVPTAATSTTTGALIIPGGAGIAGNLYVGGNASTGINAVVAGLTNTLLPNTVASFTSSANSYSQLTFQNKSSGSDATADFILTADNGSDTVNYADFGIINSGYDNATPTNSLGNIVYAADTYLYAQGNSSATSQSGGNLAIGTATAGKTVKIFAGGNTNNSLVANISNAGVAITGTVSATGNVTASNFIGNITITGNVTGTSSNVDLVAGNFTATFDNTGVLTLPTNGGDEGGEIRLGIPATNTTLENRVTVDVYQDRFRIFEGSGSAKGVYVDLSQSSAGVGTLLNNRVSGFANAGSYITMDNIKATVTTSGNRGLSLATVSGSFNYSIGGTYGAQNSAGGASTTGTLTTTPTSSIFGWGFTSIGDIATYVLTDTTNNKCYRITVHIQSSFNNNSITIERLI